MSKTKTTDKICVMSHIERCNQRFIPPTLPAKVRRFLVTEVIYDEKLKRYVKRATYKTSDRVEEMKNYRVSDFSMDNLQSIGAKLNPTQLSASNDMINSGVQSFINKFENINE